MNNASETSSKPARNVQMDAYNEKLNKVSKQGGNCQFSKSS